jgi:outer membrane beta-barrel protein
MRFMTKGTSFAAFAVALALSLPVAAQAQERKSPLADAPAVRRRVELRDKRFEIGVGASTTVGADFYNAVMVSGRLAFHLTDWLALAGWGGYNLTPNMSTSFNDKLQNVLDDKPQSDRTPTLTDALAGMNRIGEAFALQAEIVPFTGKFGLFSKLFMNYDFYAFGGPGFVDFKSDNTCAQPLKDKSCAVTGLKVGANFGLGMHLFANDFFALNIEVRDLFVPNNAAGRDTNGDRFADDHDLKWSSNFITGLNLMFFLPGRAPISP